MSYDDTNIEDLFDMIFTEDEVKEMFLEDKLCKMSKDELNKMSKNELVETCIYYKNLLLDKNDKIDNLEDKIDNLEDRINNANNYIRERENQIISEFNKLGIN